MQEIRNDGMTNTDRPVSSHKGRIIEDNSSELLLFGSKTDAWLYPKSQLYHATNLSPIFAILSVLDDKRRELLGLEVVIGEEDFVPRLRPCVISKKRV